MLSSEIDAIPEEKEGEYMLPGSSDTPVKVCEEDKLVNWIAKFEIVWGRAEFPHESLSCSKKYTGTPAVASDKAGPLPDKTEKDAHTAAGTISNVSYAKFE